MAYGKRSSAALKKETTSGTAVRPNTFIELLSENIKPDFVTVPSSPAAGIRSKMFKANKGKINAPAGTIKFTAEPNTLGHFLNGLYGEDVVTTGTVGSTTYYDHTWTETVSSSSIPTYTFDVYTPDVETSGMTKRYFGVRFGQFSLNQNNGVFEGSVSVLAKGMFAVEEFAAAAASAATSITVSKNAGLTTSDSLVLGWGSANEETVTISSVNTDGTTVGVSSTTKSHAQGDRVVIKYQTPSYSLSDQFTFYGGSDNGAVGLQGGGSTLKYGTTLGGATTLFYSEDYQFNFGQELEARHSNGAFSHESAYPRVILQKGYDAKIKFGQYFQDPLFMNHARRREPLSFIFETRADNLDAAVAGAKLLKIETPSVMVNSNSFETGNDSITDLQLDGDCFNSASDGFVSRITLRNLITDY